MNRQLQEIRESALAMLKPSKRDLDHRLALHAESVVVKSYGFSPRAAIDGARGAAGDQAAGAGGGAECLQRRVMQARLAGRLALHEQGIGSGRVEGAPPGEPRP